MNALELADELEDEHDPWPRLPAAAELRRLHAKVERLSWDSIHTCHSECQRPLCKLTRERDALLEALRAAVADWDEEVSRGRWLDAARAAIKKAEEA